MLRARPLAHTKLDAHSRTLRARGPPRRSRQLRAARQVPGNAVAYRGASRPRRAARSAGGREPRCRMVSALAARRLGSLRSRRRLRSQVRAPPLACSRRPSPEALRLARARSGWRGGEADFASTLLRAQIRRRARRRSARSPRLRRSREPMAVAHPAVARRRQQGGTKAEARRGQARRPRPRPRLTTLGPICTAMARSTSESSLRRSRARAFSSGRRPARPTSREATTPARARRSETGSGRSRSTS